ncbi:MAG: NTP transferase domain-containing protein [Deltaproteobacteria bacterium]|nr:NTP transferase domain-containing protein [Deltaproteobacteria bacterium]
MRGMIVAAGLGTRLRPLTEWLPKPAVPVRGVPLIAYGLELLAAAGVTEAVINAHHLPERLREAAERFCPPRLRTRFSFERDLLHTGGGIRRVASFLRESERCVILGGDMIVDLDLAALIRAHDASGRAVTAALADDHRVASFGSIGLDAAGRLRRIGRRFDLGGETQRGLYTWVNVLSARAFDSMPDRDVFNHLEDWWGPLAASDAGAVGGEVLGRGACAWEPVGTPAEYLAANFEPIALRYFDADRAARARGARLEPNLIAGAGAQIGADCALERVVVWPDERVPAGTRAAQGVFACGRFISCAEGGEA